MGKNKITSDLIAPCGMNCALCSAFQREIKQCPGCNGKDTYKPFHCVKCIIKHCDNIRQSKSKLCYECVKFPCARIRQIDKRYRLKYNMSMIENLQYIKANGMDIFIKQEIEKWTCKECGALICVHKNKCLTCNGK